MNRRPSKTSALASSPPGHVRIIGGRWRGSKLPVVHVDGLRPTADRVRETLFNWLQLEVAGARALDLFAGSGALGLEAASRGASQVDLVEAAIAAASSLRESVERLRSSEPAGVSPARVAVHHAQAASYLEHAARSGATWDLVFVDPPFAAGLWTATLTALVPCLAPRAHVYVESGVDTVLTPPAAWRLHREVATRDVRARLYRVEPG
jgi:16S rRNA (guanine966-N2)-methyltransferase